MAGKAEGNRLVFLSKGYGHQTRNVSNRTPSVHVNWRPGDAIASITYVPLDTGKKKITKGSIVQDQMRRTNRGVWADLWV